MTSTPTTICRRLCLAATATAAGVVTAVCPPSANAALPPAGPWPAPVVGATNPLLGSPFQLNGGHASANASLRVWLPDGRERRSALTRTIGGRTVVRGRLRDRTSCHSISGATLQIAAQNVDGGDWYLAGVARTNRAQLRLHRVYHRMRARRQAPQRHNRRHRPRTGLLSVKSQEVV